MTETYQNIVKIVAFLFLLWFILFGSDANRKEFDKRIHEDYASLQQSLEQRGTAPNDLQIIKTSYFELARNLEYYMESLDHKQGVILALLLVWTLFPSKMSKK